MFFGLLCTGAMTYGIFKIFGGFLSGLVGPKALVTATKYTTEKVELTNTEDLKYRNNEGTLSSKATLVLSASRPYLADFDVPDILAIMNTTFHLTDKEVEELTLLFYSLDEFELVSRRLDPATKTRMRTTFTRPIVAFLSKIPDMRRS